MSDPGYDFFATGRPAAVPPTAPPPGVAVPGPVTSAYAPAAAPQAPPAFPTAPIPGYNPGAVNQFGTPVAASAAPTGPYAAPGMGAVPTQSPGHTTTSSGPGGVAPTAGRARPATLRPGYLTAAAVISIVLGVIAVLVGLLGILGALALRSQLDGAGLGQGTNLAGAVTGILLFTMLVVLAIGAAYIVGGAALLKGAVWAAWTLVALHGLSALYSLYNVLTGHVSFSGLLSLAISSLVVLLILNRESQDWLRRR